MCDSSRQDRSASQAGFTLVEIVVTFTLVALALAALLPSFSDGLTSIQSSETYLRAVLLARSTADLVGHEIPIREGSYSGSSEGGFDWQVIISPLASAAADRSESVSGLAAYKVEIAVVSGGERQVTLETLRIAPLE